MPYEPTIGVGPKVNEADLGNGFYPQLSNPVAFDDDYRNKLKFLGRECSRLPAQVRLIAQSQAGDITDDTEGTPALPSVIAFGFGAEEHRLDAALVGIMPHVARIELIQRYGGGDANRVVMYEPPAAPQPDGKPSPIGAKWPEKGANAYRPADDNPQALGYKEGDTYTDATGSYVLDFQWYWVVKFPVWRKVS
jgi:hypothetical protein